MQSTIQAWLFNQYSKDGLAFQRYGRLKQDGLGDDILSGNSLSIVGLYQAIYGINPLYNRFYLDPHITPELAGTELRYNFRGERLTINLDSNHYTVSNKTFKVISPKDFGFSATKNELSYFEGSHSNPSLHVMSDQALTIAIKNWDASRMEWIQIIKKPSLKPLVYVVHQLKPDYSYLLSVNGKPVKRIKSSVEGNLVINHNTAAVSDRITISNEN